MAPKPQTYYRDDEGFQLIVVELGEPGIRVTENRDNWCDPFWMPEDEFDSLVSRDGVERVGTLSDDQVMDVLNGERNL